MKKNQKKFEKNENFNNSNNEKREFYCLFFNLLKKIKMILSMFT